MNIEGVSVDVGARSTNAPVLQAGDELSEEAEVWSEVEVAVQQIAFEQVAVVPSVCGHGPRVLVVVELVALAQLAAQR